MQVPLEGVTCIKLAVEVASEAMHERIHLNSVSSRSRAFFVVLLNPWRTCPGRRDRFGYAGDAGDASEELGAAFYTCRFCRRADLTSGNLQRVQTSRESAVFWVLLQFTWKSSDSEVPKGSSL